MAIKQRAWVLQVWELLRILAEEPGSLINIPHHSANTAVAFFVSAIAAKTRLRDCLDRSLNGRARTGGRKGEVDSGGNG